MGVSVGVPLLLLLLGLFSFGHGDLLPVPPKDITTPRLREYLALGNINMDIPALFVFGEAYVSAGNNFYLDNPPKHNVSNFKYLPYGIDFINKQPTGRSSNGRIVVDFLAQVAGLPFAPPVLGMSEEERKNTLTGVSYSSAGSAILPELKALADVLGDIISFEEQIDLFENTTQAALKAKLQTPERAAEYYSKSLFFISMGGNDMEAQWTGGKYEVEYGKKFEEYATLVSQEYAKKIERLYKLGARKFVINNVAPMYCMPDKINMTIEMSCLEYSNNQNIKIYNRMLAESIKQMESKLQGSKFFLGDVFTIFADVITNPQSFGFTDVVSACCVTAEFLPCKRDRTPCPNRNEHAYFDSWHPTESMHFVWARRLLSDSSVASPTTLIQFMQS